MADALAVRDEYRAQQWAMVVQECASSAYGGGERQLVRCSTAVVRSSSGSNYEQF